MLFPSVSDGHPGLDSKNRTAGVANEATLWLLFKIVAQTQESVQRWFRQRGVLDQELLTKLLSAILYSQAGYFPLCTPGLLLLLL